MVLAEDDDSAGDKGCGGEIFRKQNQGALVSDWNEESSSVIDFHAVGRGLLCAEMGRTTIGPGVGRQILSFSGTNPPGT